MTEPSDIALQFVDRELSSRQLLPWAQRRLAYATALDRFTAERIAQRDERIRRLEAVVQAAAAYRSAETDGTPRLWRGKALQDLADNLDAALDAANGERGE